jgi:wyosine [tRNA(Phe)-imidazoG37] synthetase (radical SAM superfamily)
MIVFGPIPSRRLGRSLGINNIPPKVCTYSCIYCQVGSTNTMTVEKQNFYSTDQIYNEVLERITNLKTSGEKIDYLTFVPDGEPTLDINLGKTIERLKSFGLKIAVITNSSLMWDKEVRFALKQADWVSVKIDSVYEDIWRKINRPHGLLDLKKIIHGIKEFASSFKGKLVSETMIVKGLNDSIESLNKTALVISEINPDKSYILIPTRPPAEKSVKVPSEESLNMAYQIYSNLLTDVELVTVSEGTDFSFSSDAEKELLSITSVHPMRKDAMEEFLTRSRSTWEFVETLIDKGELKKVVYSDTTFFIKNLKR